MIRKRKRLYRAIAIALLLVSIGFIVNDQLRRLGNRISGEYLQKLISKESKELYQLNFDEIDLSLFSQSITIRNIELTSTPKNREDSINVKTIYDAKIDEVYISLKSVIQIYTDKELVVDGIEVINPLVLMTKINPEKTSLKFGRETGELYDIISEYLDLLQINYFKIKSGAVNHSPSNFRLNAIDFDVENFTVSQKAKKKKIFYSEAIKLGVHEQAIFLPDSIHQLSFEELKLSTKDSILHFKNLKIVPRTDINQTDIFQKENQNIYDIDIPTLELKGVNYLKAYEDNYLIVNQINIPKPKIKIHSVLKSKKKQTSQVENSIGASLLALFDLIKINNFNIQEGGLNLTLKGDNHQRFLSDNISINLFNITLDSTQRDIQNIINYFEDATVEINDYDYLLPDNLHTIKFKKLNLNTFDSTVLVQDLEIKPFRSLEDSSLAQFDLNLPILKIEGVDHRDIYENDRIDLKNLSLSNSKITVTPPYSKGTKIDIITAEGLFDILNDYFTEVKLQEFSVLNSDLKVGDVFEGKALNIQSHSLTIDSTLQSWHKIAKSTEINGKELAYHLKDNHVKVKSFQSKNNFHSLDLQEINVAIADLRDQIHIESLRLRGVQFDSIVNRKKLTIDSITLVKPKVDLSYLDFKKNTPKNADWTFPEKPISITLIDGDLKYEIDPYRNFTIDDFDVEMNYQNELNLFQIYVKGFKLYDKKLNHQITLAELRLPKNRKNLVLKDIRIKPNQPTDSLSISINIPKILLTNFNRKALTHHKSFESDSVLVQVDHLNYKGSTDIKKYFDFTTDADSESGFTFSAQNGAINLKQANIVLFNTKNEPSQIRSSHTRLTLNTINFPEKENLKLSFANNFTLSNDNFTYYSPKNDTIAITNLTYNSVSEKGAIQDFNFMGTDRTTTLSIKKIALKNAQVIDYIKNNKVNIQELSSGQTTLNLRIKNQEKNLLPKAIKLPFASLQIQKFLSNDINVKLYHEKRGRDFYVRQSNLSINSLALDSTLNLKEIQHHLKSLVFSGKNYRESFGKHYTVTATDYSFHYPASDFKANNIKMHSIYDRFEYSEHIEFQNDWFKLDLASIHLKNLNVDSLLMKQRFIADKLELLQGDLVVFRDLKIPHNENRKVSMPQKVLSELDFAFSIDTVTLNSDIHIEISPIEATGTGKMTINIDESNLYNLRTHHFQRFEPILLRANGRLNEKANFNAQVNFPMPSEKSEFHFMGNIGAFDLELMDDMLIPLGAIEVRSGHSEKLQINFKGNEDYAMGLMEFRYKNLKIDFLDRETYQARGLRNNLKTFFANSFVVGSKNPRWFKIQEGTIFFERIKSRSIFNLWAKALLSGAVSSIGIKNNKEEAKAYHEENNPEAKAD